MSPHLISSQSMTHGVPLHVMSCHVKSCHVISCHVMSRHVMWWYVMPCHAMPFHVMVMSRHSSNCASIQNPHGSMDPHPEAWWCSYNERGIQQHKALRTFNPAAGWANHSNPSNFYLNWHLFFVPPRCCLCCIFSFSGVATSIHLSVGFISLKLFFGITAVLGCPFRMK